MSKSTLLLIVSISWVVVNANRLLLIIKLLRCDNRAVIRLASMDHERDSSNQHHAYEDHHSPVHLQGRLAITPNQSNTTLTVSGVGSLEMGQKLQNKDQMEYTITTTSTNNPYLPSPPAVPPISAFFPNNLHRAKGKGSFLRNFKDYASYRECVRCHQCNH